MSDLSSGMQDFRLWMTDTFFKEHVLPAMMMFTEQMSAVAMHQVFIFGTFLDAKHQLETQRLFQELQVQAHRDYHPSEDFCAFGTGARSLAASEQQGRYNAAALSAIQMARQLGNANMGAAESRDDDKAARWEQFTSVYCDPDDNNRIAATPNTGLQMACGNSGGGNTRRINIDVDFTRAIEEPRTLNVNFTDANKTPDEEDVIALSSNLYGHDVLTRNAIKPYLKNKEYQHLYMALRSVAAKRAVAQNSFSAIVGIKSAGTAGMSGETPGQPGTARFLGAVLKEMGVPDNEIFTIIGENPSYYAQMEILSKKILQNPSFYSNLYDKPANVKRKGVALKALDIMLDRAIFESQLRQEMATSVLLSSRLRPEFRKSNTGLATAGGN